ncbi:MAG: hypothetical protein MJ089_00005 [Ruminococcus sp.]|nr:hypothetical protein [Ruminococcus sp.]
MFFRIDLIDLDVKDIAQVTPANVLQLNLKYFNTLENMNNVITEFINKKILNGADIKYIATHEWGHFISVKDLQNFKSPMNTLYKRTNLKKFVSKNSAKNVYEFVADAIACKINNISCNQADKAVEYYLQEVLK